MNNWKFVPLAIKWEISFIPDNHFNAETAVQLLKYLQNSVNFNQVTFIFTVYKYSLSGYL